MGKPKAKPKRGSAKGSEKVVSKNITSKHDINTILDKAEEYMDDMKFELAQKFCERALQIDNDNVRALELTSSLLLDMGAVEQAQHCLGRAIFVEPHSGHSKYLTMAQLMTGVESRDLYRKGIEILQRRISSLPTSDESLPELRRQLSNAMVSISEIYMTDLCDEPEAEDESKKNIESAIEADPSNPEAFQAQANYALIIEEIETAKTAIDKSLQLWLPDQLKFIEEHVGKETTLSYEFRISTVKILLDLEDYDNAVTILDSLLEEDNEEVNTWYLLGWSNYLRCKEEPEYAGNALYYLEKALVVNKKCPTDDEDLIEHITSLIDELKEMGATVPDDDSDDEDEHPITELHPDQIAEILDKEAEEKETEEQNKMMPKCKSKTKFLPATFAWILLLGTTSLFFAFPCLKWYIMEQHWYAVPVFQGILTFFVLINFSMATFMDPGIIPRASPDEDRDDDFRAPLYRNVEINGITVRMKWCVTCQFYRPPRCSHCSVCNNCIEIFDHHCPWVNNCIGRRNYRHFFMFLISLSLHMTSIFILCLVHVLHKKEDLSQLTVIMSLVVMCIIALFFIPIFGLTGFHIVLVARGRTTNEQVTGKFRGGYNPFSKSCLHNCCFTLCGPQYPSLTNPAKFIGKKPRKYTVPVPIQQDGGGETSLGGPSSGHMTPASRSTRSSARGRAGQGVDPIAAQAAAAAQVRTYRDNGVKHSASAYNRMSAASEMDNGSDMDEPMGSQSKDVEPTLTHNNSKSNFFPDEESRNLSNMSRLEDSIISRSSGSNSLSNPVSSPYTSQARILQQKGYNSPHILQKPVKRSGTPEHMLSETGVEMRQMPPRSSTQSPATVINTSKVRGGVATPLAGAPPPTVSSPGAGGGSGGGRYSGLTTPSMYTSHSASGYNGQQSTGGYTPAGRRFLSESELIDAGHVHGPHGGVSVVGGGVGGGAGYVVGPSTSAGHLQDLAGSPNKSAYYTWKTDGGNSGSPSVHSYSPAGGNHGGGMVYSSGGGMYSGGGGGGMYSGGGAVSPSHGHSYAQQVGYYLQQPVTEFLAPSLQSGGPRTTPSGYPGGPVVPPGHVSPKLSRRGLPGSVVGQQNQASTGASPYASDNSGIMRTNSGGVVGHHNAPTTSSPHASPPQGPMSFTRALELTDKMQNVRGVGVPPGRGSGSGLPPSNGQGGAGGGSSQDGGEAGNRESVYDVNYEISV